MNGYSNSSGFSQSLNGIVTLTDGITQIENGNITTTGDIISNDIVSSTFTTGSLKSDSHEVSGSLIVDNDLSVGNDLTVSRTGTFINILSDGLVTLNCGVANLNSSNLITTVNLLCNYINCKKMKIDKITNHFEHKIGGYINLGISPYLKIPLTQSIYDTTTHIQNYDLSTVLINSNNNTLILLPYYIVTFYNDNIILFTGDNSSGLYPLFYDMINFTLSLTCTKILITYKNIII